MNITKIIRSLSLPAVICLLATTCCMAATTMDRYFAHPSVEDSYGVIAPWYRGLNGQCDYRVRVAAETLKRYPWTDGKTEGVDLPAYMVNGRWEIDSEGNIDVVPWHTPLRAGSKNWINGDYGQRFFYTVMGAINYYAYTGDPSAIANIKMQVDHMLDYTLTPDDHPWPRFPISVPVRGEGYTYFDPNSLIQVDIAAQQGLALLKAYQLTGEDRWFELAKHFGDVFCLNRRANNEPAAAPWGRYANPEKILGLWPKERTDSPEFPHLTGGVALIAEFLDELIRLGYNNPGIIESRDDARRYLKDHLLPAWAAFDTWGRHFWDAEAPWQGLFPTNTVARYIMNNPDVFPNWAVDARNIMSLFLNRTSTNPRGPTDTFSGAWAYAESATCCRRSFDYAPMTMSTVFGQYGEIADSEWGREMARRQILLSTYHFQDSGVVEDNIDGGSIVAATWFKIAHPMALAYTLGTMGWLPEELGAARENHIMRSSGVVNSVRYCDGRIEYSTYDAPEMSVDVLRLAFEPDRITLDGTELRRREDLMTNGYTIKRLENGDCIVHIRRDGAKNIVITGNDPQRAANHGEMSFVGAWQTEKFGAANSSLRASEEKGAYAEHTFQGNQVRVIGAAGPDGGLSEVYIDGVKQRGGGDSWNPRRMNQQVLYYKNGLPNTSHTIRILVRGEGNPYSLGSKVYVDGIQWSDAVGDSGFGSGGGPTTSQRMIFGFTEGDPYIDTNGNEWLPGTEFVVHSDGIVDSVESSWWTDSVEISNTEDPKLYSYGAHNQDFWVNVTVGPGVYNAVLKFAERRTNVVARKRAVTVLINGKERVLRMDIAATAGGFNKAVDLVFHDIEPENGIIEIRLSNDFGGEAVLQALEITQDPVGEGVEPLIADATFPQEHGGSRVFCVNPVPHTH